MSTVVVRPPSAPQIDAYKVALKYATDVINGTIVTGKLLKLAAKRFIQDLKFGSVRGLRFDTKAAQHVVDFFGVLRHSKGEWGKGGGLPFILEPWQVFILANLFGWKRADGTRRFREAHIEVARKNGKTTFMAGIALYMLVADDEPGAEVYSIATTRDQSKIVFDEAVRMRNKSPLLAQRVSSYRNNLSVLNTASKFEPQSADYGTADGKNVHCLIADELHQHPTRLLYDAYYEATGARQQALVLAITTAGYDTHGICFAQRKIGENILVGNVDAAAGDSMFVFIACIDEPDKDGKGGDDHFDEACWPKANPNLGVSVKLDGLREAAAKAKIDPTSLNGFLCKRLNVWTNQEIRWMPPAKWARCYAAGPLSVPIDVLTAARKRLEGRMAVAGLDLSSKFDLAAFALLFPPVKEIIEKVAKPQTQQDIWQHHPLVYEDRVLQLADPKWSVLMKFWVPEESIPERVKKDRVRYDVWRDAGYLGTCPGSSIDHEQIFNEIVGLRKQFNFTKVAFDSWNAQWLSKKLEGEGFEPEAAYAGYKTMSEPMKELMGMVLELKLEHFGDPILAWNASNVSATQDASGAIKPDKEKSKEKIDGIVALIMAISRIVADPTVVGSTSIYNERGIIFL